MGIASDSVVIVIAGLLGELLARTGVSSSVPD